MRSNKEYQLSKAVSTYLKLQYPNVLFHFDLAGLNLSRAQAGMTKAIQHSKGFPDLFIAKSCKGRHGLFIELKVVSPYLKDGKTLKKNEHLERQDRNHLQLSVEGYCAVFGTGFDECKKIIDNYLQPKTTH